MTTLIIKNLSWAVSGAELAKYFSKYGEVLKVVRLIDSTTGVPKKFGFLTFKDKESADEALYTMAEGDSVKSTDLEETFDRAARHLQTLVPDLDSGQLLGFYGLYKQATCGSCDIPRPNWYQMQAKHKWESWKSLGEMSREVAMASYIRAVGKLDPTWEENTKGTSEAWVAVSRLPNTDAELRDIDKTFLDWVKDGSEEKVVEFLSQDSTCILKADEDGMLPLHWAADRGHLPTIKCLVEAGADVNAKDGDGQTPLHYVASCGHVDALTYLLSKGAECLEDNDGMTPKDVADEDILPMF